MWKCKIQIQNLRGFTVHIKQISKLRELHQQFSFIEKNASCYVLTKASAQPLILFQTCNSSHSIHILGLYINGINFMILFTNYILSTVLEKKLSQQHLPHQQAYLHQLFIQYWLPVHGRFMMTEIQWQAQFLLILLNQLHLEEKLNQPLIIKLHYFNPLNF